MKKIVRNLAVVLTLSMCVTCINPAADTGIYAAAKKTTENNKKTKKKIELNKKKVTIRVNKTVKLKLKNAKVKKVKWLSSDKRVAKVTKKGLVRALKKGKAIITAKYKGKKYKCKIIVKKAKQAKKTEEIKDEKEEDKKTENLEDAKTNEPPSVSVEDAETKEPPSVSAEDVNGSTLLQSVYLVDKLYDETNILVSPASLNMVLGMATNGATDLVKEDLETYLGKSIEQYNQYSSSLIERTEDDSMLNIANGMWYREDAELNPLFANALTNSYGAVLKKSPLDHTTVNEINQWADDNTEGMIKKVIDRIPQNTPAVLINALLFKGEWTIPFQGNYTYERDFTKVDGSKVKVEMMHSTENIYYENEYAIGFEKTYGKNKEYSFISILPKAEGEFELSNLDVRNFLNTKTDKYYVEVSMPKFAYNWDATLSPILQTTNLNSIFRPELNPLGNMFQIDESMYVSEIFQACKIIVDEEGTKAASVTVMYPESSMAPGDQTNTRKVNLNRPFGYIIMDNSTNEVLFMGKVIDPTQE